MLPLRPETWDTDRPRQSKGPGSFGLARRKKNKKKSNIDLRKVISSLLVLFFFFSPCTKSHSPLSSPFFLGSACEIVADKKRFSALCSRRRRSTAETERTREVVFLVVAAVEMNALIAMKSSRSALRVAARTFVSDRRETLGPPSGLGLERRSGHCLTPTLSLSPRRPSRRRSSAGRRFCRRADTPKTSSSALTAEQQSWRVWTSLLTQCKSRLGPR